MMTLLQIDAQARKLIIEQKLLDPEAKELFNDIMFLMGFNESGITLQGFDVMRIQTYASILFLIHLDDEKRSDIARNIEAMNDKGKGTYLFTLSNILARCHPPLNQHIIDQLYSPMNMPTLGFIKKTLEEKITTRLVEDLIFNGNQNPNTQFCLKPLLKNPHLERAVVKEFILSLMSVDEKGRCSAVRAVENHPLLLESIKSRANELIEEDSEFSSHYYLQLIEVAQGRDWIIDLVSKSMGIEHDAQASEEKKIFKITMQIINGLYNDSQDRTAKNLVRDLIEIGYDYIARNLETHEDMKIFLNHDDFDVSRLNPKSLKKALRGYVLSSDLGI